MANGNGTVKQIFDYAWKFVGAAALVFTAWMAVGALNAYQNKDKLQMVCHDVEKIKERNSDKDKDWAGLKERLKSMDDKLEKIIAMHEGY